MLLYGETESREQKERRENGQTFENNIQKILEMTKYQVLTEIEVRRQFGKDITAIDHLLITDKFLIAFQDKWRESKTGNSDIHHFIHCVTEVQINTGIMCLAIYLSRKSLTSVSELAFERQNAKNVNYYISIHSESFTPFDTRLET